MKTEKSVEKSQISSFTHICRAIIEKPYLFACAFFCMFFSILQFSNNENLKHVSLEENMKTFALWELFSFSSVLKKLVGMNNQNESRSRSEASGKFF
jgi:hypothetical protein